MDLLSLFWKTHFTKSYDQKHIHKFLFQSSNNERLRAISPSYLLLSALLLALFDWSGGLNRCSFLYHVSALLSHSLSWALLVFQFLKSARIFLASGPSASFFSAKNILPLALLDFANSYSSSRVQHKCHFLWVVLPDPLIYIAFPVFFLFTSCFWILHSTSHFNIFMFIYIDIYLAWIFICTFIWHFCSVCLISVSIW